MILSQIVTPFPFCSLQKFCVCVCVCVCVFYCPLKDDIVMDLCLRFFKPENVQATLGPKCVALCETHNKHGAFLRPRVQPSMFEGWEGLSDGNNAHGKVTHKGRPAFSHAAIATLKPRHDWSGHTNRCEFATNENLPFAFWSHSNAAHP